MLNLLTTLKSLLNQNYHVLVNGCFILVQKIGIIKQNNEPKLIINEGSLKGHLITNQKYNVVELGEYIKSDNIILDMDYNKIHILITVLENMKALELTQSQWIELTTLMSKTKY